MKKIIFAICLAVGTTLGVNAQEKVRDKDVPPGIQTNFTNQFPDASAVEWKMKDGKYKVHFMANGTKQMASFDASGTFLSKGIEIRESELPAAIATSVKSSYSSRTIDEVYKIDKEGATNYLVKLNGNPETKLFYGADGQLIKDKSNW